jgi:asparagine synthase (glutamine-hydrolysing)
MTEQLRHRGPDGSGVINTPRATLGHTRLAILDVDFGQQPMQYGHHWISFNGEIYNHADLRARHLAGERFNTRTDTETVLRLYTKYGPRCIDLLDGMFAFAVIEDGGLFLARDPLGIKPLYYGSHNDTLVFASEIKSLTKLTNDIHEFPAGHWFHTLLGMHRYYGAEQYFEQQDQFNTLEEALPAINETLQNSVHKRLMSDVPLGVSLSGGLDSSIISALARESIEQLDSFAVGVDGSSDLAAAREVANFLGTRHHEYVYTQHDMLQALPKVLFSLESFDPALVRSAIPNYFLARLAADHVKVILSGEGADELYAGYAYLGKVREPAALQAEMISITSSLHNTNLQRADRMSMAFGLEMRVPFLDVASVGLAFSLPAEWKLHQPGWREKTLLRRTFADRLPTRIVNRPKEKFSKGAGSSDMIAHLADETISDAEFTAEKARLQRDWDYRLPSKEALYYYRTLHDYYRDEWIMPTMGHSRSI